MAAAFHAKGSGSQTTGLAFFTASCTISAGDQVVVFGSWDAASTITPGVTTTGGTGSDTFKLVYGPFTSGSWKYAAWLLASAGTGRTGAQLFWGSSNPSFADAACISFTGLANPYIDGNAFASGSSTAPRSGNTATLTTTDQLAVGYAASAGAVTASGAPWTDDGVIAVTTSWYQHQILTANTAVNSNFTATNATWISFALTIKATNFVYDQSNVLTGTDDGGGDANVNIRQVLTSAVLNPTTGNQARVTLLFGTASSTTPGAITSMYIGQAAASGHEYDFKGNQVQVLFSGSGSVGCSPAGVVVSDWVTLGENYDNTKNYVISWHVLSSATGYTHSSTAITGVDLFADTGGADSSATSVLTLAQSFANSGSLIEKFEIQSGGGVTLPIMGQVWM